MAMRARVSRTAVVGAAALLVASAAQRPTKTVTFGREVWPILERRCVSCHQTGEIAPMPLTSYSEVRPWARAIRQAVLTGKMPPWHAVNSNHIFRNDRRLLPEEIQTMISWVEAGSPKGPPIRPYRTPRQESRWKLGNPDWKVQVPGFHVPTTGPVPYSFLIVPTHFTEDVWVRAAEFRIDQRSVIHHINAFVRPPGSSFLEGFPAGQIFVPTIAERGRKRANEGIFDRRELLQGYEPGYEPTPWLVNGAKLVRAGSDIIFELHYNPNGKPLIDHSELGLYFAKEPPEQRVLAIDTLRDLDLLIPPKDDDYRSEAALALTQPVHLLSVQPHMHLRGKAMLVRAEHPDGAVDVLVDVPKYDFNWQTTYMLKQPMLLLPGTRLISVARFDNSSNNPYNPDPNSAVHWGDQTFDEMHIAFLELAVDRSADVGHLLQQQPKMIH
jgi:Copper type II ascorbate-dependent monooxygenase, C-terminal domain